MLEVKGHLSRNNMTIMNPNGRLISEHRDPRHPVCLLTPTLHETNGRPSS